MAVTYNDLLNKFWQYEKWAEKNVDNDPRAKVTLEVYNELLNFTGDRVKKLNQKLRAQGNVSLGSPPQILKLLKETR